MKFQRAVRPADNIDRAIRQVSKSYLPGVGMFMPISELSHAQRNMMRSRLGTSARKFAVDSAGVATRAGTSYQRTGSHFPTSPSGGWAPPGHYHFHTSQEDRDMFRQARRAKNNATILAQSGQDVRNDFLDRSRAAGITYNTGGKRGGRNIFVNTDRPKEKLQTIINHEKVHASAKGDAYRTYQKTTNPTLSGRDEANAVYHSDGHYRSANDGYSYDARNGLDDEFTRAYKKQMDDFEAKGLKPGYNPNIDRKIKKRKVNLYGVTPPQFPGAGKGPVQKGLKNVLRRLPQPVKDYGKDVLVNIKSGGPRPGDIFSYKTVRKSVHMNNLSGLGHFSTPRAPLHSANLRPVTPAPHILRGSTVRPVGGHAANINSMEGRKVDPIVRRMIGNPWKPPLKGSR